MKDLTIREVIALSQILCDIEHSEIYGNAVESMQTKVTEYLKAWSDEIEALRFAKS